MERKRDKVYLFSCLKVYYKENTRERENFITETIREKGPNWRESERENIFLMKFIILIILFLKYITNF